MSELEEARSRRPKLQIALTEGPWGAVPEVGGDNFADSIYGPKGDYDGLLIARCNQNGAHNADTAVLTAAWEMREALIAAKSYIDSLPIQNQRGYDSISKVITAALISAQSR